MFQGLPISFVLLKYALMSFTKSVRLTCMATESKIRDVLITPDSFLTPRQPLTWFLSLQFFLFQNAFEVVEVVAVYRWLVPFCY